MDMSNIHNKEAFYYKVELYHVRPWLRKAFKEIPGRLADRITLYNGGRTVRTDLDALWQFVRPEELRSNKALVRLEHDMRWRFSHILHVDHATEPPAYLLGVRDYLLRTTFESCTAEEKEELERMRRFHAVCRQVAEQAESKEACAEYLSTHAIKVATLLTVATGGTVSSIDSHTARELAMLECALCTVKAAYGVEDEVTAQCVRLTDSADGYLAREEQARNASPEVAD